MNFKNLFKVLLVSLFAFSLNIASALQLDPLSVVLKPSGGGAKQSFKVANNNDKPIAVQFSVTTRAQVNNKEVRQPADDKFSIYPSQTIIPPKSVQKVRIEWLGEKSLPKEASFRLIAEQVHVALSEQKQTGLNMLMTMIGALYVEPNGVSSNVNVASVKRHGNKLLVLLKNTGKKHQLMKYATLTLSNGSQNIVLKGKQLQGLDGNNVLAESQKEFGIPLPAGFVGGNWSASIKYPQ